MLYLLGIDFEHHLRKYFLEICQPPWLMSNCFMYQPLVNSYPTAPGPTRDWVVVAFFCVGSEHLRGYNWSTGDRIYQKNYGKNMGKLWFNQEKCWFPCDFSCEKHGDEMGFSWTWWFKKMLTKNFGDVMKFEKRGFLGGSFTKKNCVILMGFAGTPWGFSQLPRLGTLHLPKKNVISRGKNGH